MMDLRPEPISIEALLQKQKEEKEAAARASHHLVIHVANTEYSSQPKFLTKEERAKVAIAKRAQELKDEKQKAEKERQDREALEREAEEIRSRERDRGRESRYGSGAGRCQCLVDSFHKQSFNTFI
jgi:ATP-dependent RNA helicase DDX23/PRP28